MMELSPMTPTADSGMDCHMKQELAIPAGITLDSPTAFIMTVDNGSSRFPTEVSFLRDSDKSNEDDIQNKDLLYILSQRFENVQAPLYAVPRKVDDEQPTRQGKKDRAENTDPQFTKSLQPLRVCIYFMGNMAIDLEVDDGPNSTVNDMLHSILLDENVGLPRTAAAVFSLWMCSTLVELQLRPQHKPFEMRARWKDVVRRFSNVPAPQRSKDEPSLTFQRNVFLSRRDEDAITDGTVLNLLYEEAKYNILEGRYPCEAENYVFLAGLEARIQFGPYNPQLHTIQFFRERLSMFLPQHERRKSWSWLPISSKKNSLEMKLLEQYKRIPPNTAVIKLVQKYLEFCRGLPYYGCAFFHGQVEEPVRGLYSLITHQDLPVLVGINEQGIYVIDQLNCTLLLGLKYEDMSWDYAKPSQEDNPECIPCLFIQFRVLENGTRVTKILQVFSKQAVIMDALISVFVHTANPKEEIPKPAYETSTDSDETHMPLTSQRNITGISCLSNKLNKLTLATFDDEGHCIGQMGSWSFSY